MTAERREIWGILYCEGCLAKLESIDGECLCVVDALESEECHG